MINLIKNTYNKNKLLGVLLSLLLIVPVILWLFKDVILSYLAGSSDKLVKQATERDNVLKAEVADLKEKADQANQEANRIDQEAANLKDDPDWHNKRGSADFSGIAIALILGAGALFVQYLMEIRL